MEVARTLTDDHKRAIRYLGYSQEDVITGMNRQCTDFLENLVKQAKQKCAQEKTMKEIDPSPLS